MPALSLVRRVTLNSLNQLLNELKYVPADGFNTVKGSGIYVYAYLPFSCCGYFTALKIIISGTRSLFQKLSYSEQALFKGEINVARRVGSRGGG